MPILKYTQPAGPAGTVPDEDTLTVHERGSGNLHQTEITMTATPLTSAQSSAPIFPADAEEGGVLIYTFPAGVHRVNWARILLTGMEASTNTNAMEYGLGSTLAAGDSATLGTTDEDYVLGSPALTAVGTYAAGAEGTGDKTNTDTTIWAATDAKTIHFNVAATWTATVTAPTVTGIILIDWEYMGA